MDNARKAPPVSLQLPFDVRMALARAAQTPVSPGHPYAREKAINAAMARVKAAFPQLFKE